MICPDHDKVKELLKEQKPPRRVSKKEKPEKKVDIKEKKEETWIFYLV